jgi:hypothetical protein
MSTPAPGLPAIQFSIQDLQTADGIERVLLQIQGQIAQIVRTEPPPINVNTLAQQIWTINLQQLTALIQQQIQAAK